MLGLQGPAIIIDIKRKTWLNEFDGVPLAWFNNRYVCPECKVFWESDWSSGCDDECPGCGCSDVSPVESIDLTVIVEPSDEGSWTIWRSPPEAGDDPEYRCVGKLEFPKSGGARLVLPDGPA